MSKLAIVLDTNGFVAAGFNSKSSSARLIEAVRAGRVRLVWDRATRQEIEHVLKQIPPLSWSDFSDLFSEEHCHQGETNPEEFGFIPDPADQKFIALANAAGAILVSRDEHLLDYREETGVPILKPREFVRRYLT